MISQDVFEIYVLGGIIIYKIADITRFSNTVTRIGS